MRLAPKQKALLWEEVERKIREEMTWLRTAIQRFHNEEKEAYGVSWSIGVMNVSFENWQFSL